MSLIINLRYDGLYRINIKKGTVKIRNQLKKYRERADYKQQESAKLLDITTRQYQRLESQTPKSVIQFQKLAKLYGTTIDDLLEQEVKNQ